MKKLISILGTITIAASIMLSVVANSPYHTNNISQYNNLKMPIFVSDDTATINLNDVFWIKTQKNNTIVHFTNSSEPVTYSNTLMWNKVINQIKDNSQYFRNGSNILNGNYIISANKNNDFILNNGITAKLSADTYNKFIEHISK